MAFQEKLEVAIETIFNSAGFDKMQSELKKTMAQFKAMNSLMRNAKGLANMRKQTRDLDSRLSEAGFNFQKMTDDVDNLSGQQIGGLISGNDIENTKAAKSQIKQFGGVIRNSAGEVADMGNVMEALTNQFDRAGVVADAGFSTGVGAANEELDKLQRKSGTLSEAFSSNLFGQRDTRSMPGFSPGQFEMPNASNLSGSTMQRALLSMGVMNEELSMMGQNVQRANKISGFKKRVASTTGSIKNMIPATRALQMRLLGLQFTMLTVAFIFGGLMASALGAVGVFEVLGNTLKFLFLPTALNVLDSVLGFQDAIMGLDKETRQMIGDLFLWISVGAVVVGILAALGKAVLTVLGPVSSLVGFLGSFGSGGVIGGLVAVGSTIASWLPPILAVIAILVSLLTIFNRFPGVASFLMDVFNFVFSNIFAHLKLIFENVTSIIMGLLNVLTGFITLVLGLLTGNMDKAKAGFEELLFGIKQIFIDTIVNIINFFINRVNSIVGMIPGVDSPLSNITAPNIGQDFGPDDTGGGTTQLQQNNINASVQVNDKEETPQETGRKFGQGLSQGLNQRSSNITSGT